MKQDNNLDEYAGGISYQEQMLTPIEIMAVRYLTQLKKLTGNPIASEKFIKKNLAMTFLLFQNRVLPPDKQIEINIISESKFKKNKFNNKKEFILKSKMVRLNHIGYNINEISSYNLINKWKKQINTIKVKNPFTRKFEIK